MDDGEYRNWAELPPNLTSSILVKLGMIDILENAQKVCKSWHRVCKDPWMWQKIHIENCEESFKYDLESMCRHAVDRSQGGLVEINICYFSADELLGYIANRSHNLRVLRLIAAVVTERRFTETVVKLPLLEHIENETAFSSSLMSTSISSPMNKKQLRNWAELPSDLTSEILSRVGAVDILENAQKVCKSWHRVCKDPRMWRKIDLYNPKVDGDMYIPLYKDLMTMCCHAVDRSQGGLAEIDIWYFCDAELLNYIADRSSNLRILRFMECDWMIDKVIIEAVVKLQLLEHFEVSYCLLTGKSLRVVGQSCPNLRTLKLFSRDEPNFFLNYYDKSVSDDHALAIAESMPQLRHLELFGNWLTSVGLNAILDGCPHLESLDLYNCFDLHLTEDLEKRCIERFKDWKPPYLTDLDSDDDYFW